VTKTIAEIKKEAELVAAALTIEVTFATKVRLDDRTRWISNLMETAPLRDKIPFQEIGKKPAAKFLMKNEIADDDSEDLMKSLFCMAHGKFCRRSCNLP
jgi:hypothetical protein